MIAALGMPPAASRPQSEIKVPPSITMFCPVTNAPARDASQTTAPATSSGVPKRPRGVFASRAVAASASAVMGAINGLGTTFAAPGAVGGRSRFGPDRHDGGDAVRVFGYIASCQCLRYTGPVVAAPQ